MLLIFTTIVKKNRNLLLKQCKQKIRETKSRGVIAPAFLLRTNF